MSASTESTDEPVLDRSKTPPIPTGTKPLQHQVAGHIFGRSNGQRVNKIGFLQSTDGAVLKPVLGDSKGDREVAFYEKLFADDCQDDVLLGLRQFVPKFLGLWTTPIHPGVLYIKLEDITHQYRHPCIMDIKVGPVTFDHEADEAKITREKAKSPSLPEIGFQIVGVRRYNPSRGDYSSFDRNLVRTLNPETVLTKGLAMYFHADESFDASLVHVFLRRLGTIESLFNSQTSYHFIASSLLFVYDGDAFHSLPPSNAATSADNCSSGRSNGCPAAGEASADNGVDSFWEEHVTLKMIDFTHSYPAFLPDNNYLIGLRSLIRYMNLLKPGTYQPDP